MASPPDPLDRERMMSTSDVPRLLRIREVSQLTGIEEWRLYELIAQGQGPPHMRIGRTIRISEVALARWIEESHRQGPGGEP